MSRCTALRDALKARRVRTELLIHAGKGLSRGVVPKGHRIFDWQRNGPLERSLESADVAVIDSYLADRKLYRKAAAMVDVLLCLDDVHRLSYPPGFVLNAALDARKRNYPGKKGTRYLLGGRYALLRKEFWTVPRPRVPKTVKRVLIALGGGDHDVLTRRIAGLLKTRFGFEVERIGNGSPKLSAGSVRKILLRCDLCVSGGGQILNELARCGVPTIAVAMAQNQWFNIQSRLDRGLIAFAGWHDDRRLMARMERAVERMDFKTRLSLSRKSSQASDGKGAQRVVDALLKEARG